MSNNTSLTWEESVTHWILAALQDTIGLADDPDNILFGDVLLELAKQGVEIVNVSSPMVLRFEYEVRFRGHPNSRQEFASILFVPSFPIDTVPYDIQKQASAINLSLRQFFPTLSYRVLRYLPPDWWPVLHQNQLCLQKTSDEMSDAETAKFVIQHCLGLEHRKITSVGELFALLSEVVLRNLKIPSIIQKYLISPDIDASFLPLSRLLSHPSEARAYLQKVWSTYTEYATQEVPAQVAETLAVDVVPFLAHLANNPISQNKITGLLFENVLKPAVISSEATPPVWMRSSVHYYVDETMALEDQLARLGENMPGEAANFETWTTFAQEWARWRVTYFRQATPLASTQASQRTIQAQIHQQFADWLLSHYASLLQQPYLPYPTTVHQALRFLATSYQPSPKQPLALVVVDGMAYEDWLIIRDAWEEAGISWQMEESAILALVPTLTSVSRQALLSGKLPRHFAQSWLTTQHEEKHWRTFWEAMGIHPDSIGYIRNLGKSSIDSESHDLETRLENTLSRPHLGVIALIVNTVDELAHHNLL
ncbi:MAG: BREX-3 system phosphatase PglZ, partial [Chloroflexota bacterium]